MRVCPECGYRDPPIWRPAKMHNPGGEVDIARIDDVQVWHPEIAKELREKRGTVVCDGHYAYLLGKKAVWVRRIASDTYRDCGKTAFNAPHETSKLNPLARQVTGRTRTTRSRAKRKLDEWVGR